MKNKLEQLLKEAGNKQLNLNSQAARDYLVEQIINLINENQS